MMIGGISLYKLTPLDFRAAISLSPDMRINVSKTANITDMGRTNTRKCGMEKSSRRPIVAGLTLKLTINLVILTISVIKNTVVRKRRLIKNGGINPLKMYR
jgi:hypothetical protein